jgi:hypothetical protein
VYREAEKSWVASGTQVDYWRKVRVARGPRVRRAIALEMGGLSLGGRGGIRWQWVGRGSARRALRDFREAGDESTWLRC